MNSAALSRADLEFEARIAIRRVLAAVPGIHIVNIEEPADREVDFVVSLVADGGRQTLLCEAKSRAWPNELLAISSRLRREADADNTGRSLPVLVAPYVSEPAAEACRTLGLSWVDLVGNCELRLDGAFVKLRGTPNPHGKGRGTQSLYSAQSSRVVHALLLNYGKRWTTRELACMSGVSMGQVAAVKKLLDQNGWIETGYGSTVLTEPRKLLDDWAANYRPRRSVSRFFALDSPDVLEVRIAASVHGYAFTEFSAAERYAPYTRHQRVAFYVPSWDAAGAQLIGLRGGDGAANVTIYETGGAVPFVQDVNGARCASPVQAYLDLKLLAGRGQDAAQHLLERNILPGWK